MKIILILGGLFLIFYPPYSRYKFISDNGHKMLVVGALSVLVGVVFNPKDVKQKNNYRPFDAKKISKIRTYEDGYSLAKELGIKDYSACYATTSSYYEGCAAAVSENISE